MLSITCLSYYFTPKNAICQSCRQFRLIQALFLPQYFPVIFFGKSRENSPGCDKKTGARNQKYPFSIRKKFFPRKAEIDTACRVCYVDILAP
jgi:hypothetical protein